MKSSSNNLYIPYLWNSALCFCLNLHLYSLNYLIVQFAFISLKQTERERENGKKIERGMVRESDKERERGTHLLVHSPNVCNIWGWVRCKVRDHLWVVGSASLELSPVNTQVSGRIWNWNLFCLLNTGTLIWNSDILTRILRVKGNTCPFYPNFFFCFGEEQLWFINS